MPDPGILATYGHRLDVPALERTVSLGEGATPLLSAEALLEPSGFRGEFYLKVEGANPTGSFLDRGMTVAISVALSEGAAGILCASTGSSGASAAAYAARAGLPCTVVAPVGQMARGQRVQILAHGARLLEIEGAFDAALELVHDLGAELGLFVVNSKSLERIEGQSTAAYEVFDQLGGRAPETHVLPVCDADNVRSYWRGYTRLWNERRAFGRPRLVGVRVPSVALSASEPCPPNVDSSGRGDRRNRDKGTGCVRRILRAGPHSFGPGDSGGGGPPGDATRSLQ